MPKDPAFLFYPGDASEDTQFMNRLERGCYFDLLKAQKKFGSFTLDQIKKVLGKDFEECWPALELVLIFQNGFYFIEWVDDAIQKRKKHCELQSDNGRKGGRPAKNNPNETQTKPNNNPEALNGFEKNKPLENGNAIENRIINEKENTDEKPENFFSEKGIAPMMVQVFQSVHHNYPKDQEKDFSSCLEIAYKIAESNGWTKNQVLDEKRMEAVKFWEQIVHFSAADKWFCTRSISDLNKEWQRLIQTINNARTPTNGKKNSAVNGQQLNEAHFKRFGNR